MITDIIRDDASGVVDRLDRLLAPLAGSTVLVTGAAGFLGGFFLDVLDAFNARNPGRPARVFALDTFLVGPPERIAHLLNRPWITCRTANVALPIEPPVRADWILHCASIGSPSIYRTDPLQVIASNVQGTWNLLEAARSHAKGMLVLSSSDVYGDAALVPTPEDHHGSVDFTGPRSCHDESKRLAETLCSTYFRLHRVPVTVARPFNIYGPGQRLDDGRTIPDLIRSTLAGGPLVVFPDGGVTQSYCYVTDFAEACLTLLMMPESAGEAFNVGSPEEYTLLDCAMAMAEASGDPAIRVESILRGEDPAALNRRRCPDLTKVQRLTGYEPRVGLRQGLERTLASYREECGMVSLRRVAQW